MRNFIRMDHPFVIGFLIITVVATMSLASEVLKPLALAILLCFTLAPFCRVLERWGLPRGGAVILTVLLTMGLMGGVGFVISRQLLSLMNRLPVYESRILNKVESLRPTNDTAVDRLQKVLDDVSARLEKPLSSEPERPVTDVRIVSPPTFGERVLETISPLLEPVVAGVLVLVLVLFLLWQREDMLDRLIQLFGHGRFILTVKTIEEAGLRISRYLAMLAVMNTCSGLIVGLGLWAIGIPYAALWGTLAALFRFIPYLGPVVAYALPFLFSLASSPAGSWAQPLEVLALVAAFEVTASYLEPCIYGRATEVSAFGLLLAAMFWTWLWGGLGLLLSTPMTVCLAVVGKYVPSLHFLATLLGQGTTLAPDIKFYLRLLALDQDGATEIIETALKQTPRVEVFDTILIPALARTKRDIAREELPDKDQVFIGQVVADILDELEGMPESPTEAIGEPSSGPMHTHKAKLVGVAVDDMSDALVLRMLAQVLVPSGSDIEIISERASALKLSEVVAGHNPDLVLLSHLPPGGLTLTRSLIKRLRTRLPSPPIVVGYWEVNGDLTRVSEKLKAAGASSTVGSLAEARARILETIPLQSVQTPVAPLQSPVLVGTNSG